MTLPAWSLLVALCERDRLLVDSWLREAQGRMAMLGGEMATWAGSWLGKSGTPGPVISLFWMALIIWVGAAFAGWSVSRGRHALLSFLPLGGALALSTYLADEGSAELTLFLACVVAMVPVNTARWQQQDWDARGVPYPEVLELDTLTAAVVAAAIFVISATTLPEVRASRVVDWFWRLARGPQRTSEEVLNRAFPGARPPRARSYLPPTTGAVLPREHLLGGSPTLQCEVVMLVRTDEPPPLPEELGLDAGLTATFYWRGTVYSDYVGTGWQRGKTRLTQEAAYTALDPSGPLARRPLRQDFELRAPHGDTLYAAADPHSANQPVNVRRMAESGDLVAIEGASRAYKILSMVPEVTLEQLEEASGPYPELIEWEYTSLPEDMPDRVLQLAREVTAGAESILKHGLALEAYLRTIPYDLQVARPPKGRDVVDYFLFDLQRGYCDYFASAMVVMARAVGIPARLAVGYGMGHYDSAEGAYVVTAADAHAWPELYFNRYGWIPFEPTSGFSPLTRLQASVEQPAPLSLATLPQRSWAVRLQVAGRLLWLRWRNTALAVFIGLALACAVGWWWRWWMPGLGAEERAAWNYWRLRQMAPRLGVAIRPSDTPSEFSATMRESLSQRRSRWGMLRPAVKLDVEQAKVEVALLAETYEQASYAPSPPESALLRRVRSTSPHLGWRLLRLWALSTPE
jgi:transglutaminase-like putative cysteine protease